MTLEDFENQQSQQSNESRFEASMPSITISAMSSNNNNSPSSGLSITGGQGGGLTYNPDPTVAVGNNVPMQRPTQQMPAFPQRQGPPPRSYRR